MFPDYPYKLARSGPSRGRPHLKIGGEWFTWGPPETSFANYLGWSKKSIQLPSLNHLSAEYKTWAEQRRDALFRMLSSAGFERVPLMIGSCCLQYPLRYQGELILFTYCVGCRCWGDDHLSLHGSSEIRMSPVFKPCEEADWLGQAVGQLVAYQKGLQQLPHIPELGPYLESS